MARRWYAVLVAAASVVALVTALGGSRVYAVTPPASPVAVVEQYIAALDRHDGGAVCRLFSPQLKDFETRWDAQISGGHSCPQIIGGHFRYYYSRHRWASARVVAVTGTDIDAARGIATVHLKLSHHYICAGNASLHSCHPGYYVRPDIVYLISESGQWKVIKPGFVYRASEIPQPDDSESLYYPPGDAKTVKRPAAIPAPRGPCRGTSATAQSKPHVLKDQNYKTVSAPWLNIRRLTVTRLAQTTVCFTFTLGAVPRADSSYGIYLGSVAQQAPELVFGLDIDGLGQPHLLLTGRGSLSSPGLARYLPHAWLAGKRLEIIATLPHFIPHRRFLVDVESGSLQNQEPLLLHPLEAGDGAPRRGCLIWPTGSILLKGLCGSVPGP
jgi:hypothetical protein